MHANAHLCIKLCLAFCFDTVLYLNAVALNFITEGGAAVELDPVLFIFCVESP